jgi:hypothetical protein
MRLLTGEPTGSSCGDPNPSGPLLSVGHDLKNRAVAVRAHIFRNTVQGTLTEGQVSRGLVLGVTPKGMERVAGCAGQAAWPWCRG